MKFASFDFNLDESNVVAFGVPLGKNPNKSLQSLRYVSQFVEPMDLDSGVNLLENVKLHDSGDMELTSLDRITEETKKILQMNKPPLILGGNHLLSLYSLKAFENVKLVVFDAHGDFKNSYDDEKIREMNEGFYNPNINDATWLRRVSEFIKPENIMLLGVRSCDEFELNDLKKSGIKYFTSRKIIENQEVLEQIKEFTKNSRVYISFDVDVFDPSICPAVDMPEPDGIFFNNFQKMMQSVNGKIVGIDVCCLNSQDNEISEFLIARSVFEILHKI
ncbi:MAG: arginase family protein [Candidatus Aenigmarchaeota archaeon]|nr:arginase family protein [Candidatus Aenigmarchaeota archaeon]